MKKKLSFVCGVLLFTIPIAANSQYLSFTPETDSLVAVGINQLHNLQLQDAVTTFEVLIRDYPEHPIGYFYKAGVYDLFNQNYRITKFEKEFEEAVDIAVETGEKYIKKNKDDALAYFYLGGAYGFRGLHRFYKRDWLHVFIDGYKGLKNLHKSLEKRPDFYDAYFGLGLYNYWRSAMTKKLRFLPFVSDQRQHGINEIRLAVEKGRFAGVESRIALTSVYYNEAKYDSALIVNDWLYERFPFDPSITYYRTKIFEKRKQWDHMLETAQKLHTLINTYEYKSIGYLIECNYLMALAYSNLNQNEQAIHHLETAIQLNDSRDKDKELEGPNEDFDDIFKHVKELHKTLISG